MRSPVAVLVLSCVLPAAAVSSSAGRDAIAANTLWIFYHELGHALIDQLDLPVLGKEEDAADHLAVLLSDALWDDARADRISDHVSAAFWRAAETAQAPAPWWDEHSTDQQRHYSVACLYYGGDAEGRAHVPQAIGLPPERAELCIAERAQIEDAWGPVLDRLAGGGFTEKLHFHDRLDAPADATSTTTTTAAVMAEVLADEVAALNAQFSLPEGLGVVIMACGEENAFYDPQAREIQICAEYGDFLDRLFRE